MKFNWLYLTCLVTIPGVYRANLKTLRDHPEVSELLSSWAFWLIIRRLTYVGITIPLLPLVILIFLAKTLDVFTEWAVNRMPKPWLRWTRKTERFYWEIQNTLQKKRTAARIAG